MQFPAIAPGRATRATAQPGRAIAAFAPGRAIATLAGRHTAQPPEVSP